MKSVGRYGSVGIELLASMGLGYYGGSFLDRKLGTHWIALVGFLLGAGAGFRALYQTAMKMQRELEREDKALGPDPPWKTIPFDDVDPPLSSRRPGDAPVEPAPHASPADAPRSGDRGRSPVAREPKARDE